MIIDSKRNRILVVNHSGHPGGAPISLRNLLIYTKSAFDDIEIDIVHLDKGLRISEFDPVAMETHFPVSKNRFELFQSRLFRKLYGQTLCNVKLPDSVVRNIIQKKYKCIFVNTVIGLPLVRDWLKFNIPIFCWVHELEKVCSEVFGRDTESILSLPITYVACSQAVDDFLSSVNPNRKSLVLSECIEPDFFIGQRRDPKPIQSTLSVGMIGTVSKRKGYDLFAKVVNATLVHTDEIRFRWVGYDSGDCTDDFVDIINELGLGNCIQLVPYQSSSFDQMACLDVLLLTSREDPNPLVVIEALASGVVPIVQRDTGGAVRLAEVTDGFVVDYESIDQMVSCILGLSADYRDLNRRSLAAQAYASEYLHPLTVVKEFRNIVLGAT